MIRGQCGIRCPPAARDQTRVGAALYMPTRLRGYASPRAFDNNLLAQKSRTTVLCNFSFKTPF